MVGSGMSEFALLLWTWETTQSATALALMGFFYALAQIPISLFAGIWVDRFNRKKLMMLADMIAALTTVGIGILYFTDSLLIWHIYVVAAINGGFGQIQSLAYQTSVSLMVTPRHYARASSMDSAVQYGSEIIAPALVGILYPLIQLSGLLLIDLTTFLVSVISLLLVRIPQPVKKSTPTESERTITRQLTFGLRYVWNQHQLRTLILVVALFWFVHDLGDTLYEPMILARTDGDAGVLAGTAAAAGIGGVTGAIILSVWGGPKQRILGMLLGFMGAGLSKVVFGLGRSPAVWLPTQFCSSLSFPLLDSSETAIWMESTAPEIQGRVFAANELIVQIVGALAALIAGPLADRALEPMMQSAQEGEASSPPRLLSYVFGTGPGAGSSILYVGCAIAMLLIGLVGSLLYEKHIKKAPPSTK